MIRIHNSMTGLKENFEPINPGRVRMYVCGITVYDFIHIGHARMLVVFDVVYRYLRHRGYEVTYVRNVTDIDDKIIQRAARNGEAVDAVTARYIHAMHEDCARLALVPPDHEPRATAHVPQIVTMIERLIEGGYAYRASDGDVLYAVAKFDGYGRLSGKRLADLRAGARVEVSEAKRDPLDFVLWKAAKAGEPAWDSPWGPGRPGWHIECSAMSTAILGAHFDIHGGGIDLKFPHHENEIAQSCAATGEKFVNVWMHNGFVNVNEEKMSKSLGNFFTVRDVLPTLRHPEVLRYFILSSHYRGPINYSTEQLAQADAALGRIYTALRDAPLEAMERSTGAGRSTHAARFQAAMDDDFNTAEAFAVLQSLAREINTARAAGRTDDATALAGELRGLAQVLGIAQLDPAEWFRRAAHGDSAAAGAIGDDEIERSIAARRAARQAKDWKESDRIRDELAARGVVLEDRPDGATGWRRE